MQKNKGFTLVEVLVIIVVIGILTTITIISVGNWRKNTAETEVKSDLKNLASAMEAARNFGSGYPTSIPSTFTASDNVTVTYDSGNATSYCVNGVSTADATVQYYINTATNGREPQAGTC